MGQIPARQGKEEERNTYRLGEWEKLKRREREHEKAGQGLKMGVKRGAGERKIG